VKSPASIATFAATRIASSALIGAKAETSRRLSSSCVARSASSTRRQATIGTYVSRGSIPGASTRYHSIFRFE
jgi:hypothetical protein